MSDKKVWTAVGAIVLVILGFVLSQRTTPPDPAPAMIAEMRTDLASIGDSISGLSERIAANDATLASLTEDLQGLAGGIDDLRNGMEASSAAQTEVSSDLNAAVAKVTETDKALRDLSAGQAALGQELGSLADRVATLGTAGASAAAAAAPPEAAAVASSDPAPAVATASAQDDLAGHDGLTLGIGETAQAGDARVFLSRLSDAGAYLRVTGKGDVMAPAGGRPVDIGGGCDIALIGVASGQAMLAPTCKPFEAAAETTLPDATEFELTVGQTARFGDARVFLSRLDNGGAYLRVFEGGDAVQTHLMPQQPHLMGNGCGLALAGLDARMVRVQGACGDAVAALADIAPQKTAAVAALAVAAPQPAATGAPDADRSLSVGQTLVVGDRRVFVSRLADESATLVLIGEGPVTVDMHMPLDLGNGCDLTLTGLDASGARLESSCR